MNQVEIGSHKFTAPANWQEMNSADLLYFASICLKKIPLDWAKKLAVIGLFKIPKHLFKKLKEHQQVQLFETIEFLGENKLNKWVISKFRINLKVYYGPDDKLANLTIAEYRQTEILYQIYLKKRDPKTLLLLIATLYRPKRKGIIQNDIREALTEMGAAERRKQMESLSPAFRHAILLNYEGCRRYIQEKFPTIFTKAEGEVNKNIFDLEEIIEAVAGEKFGSFSETENTNLFRFFRHLVNQMERAEEMERKK